MYMYHSARPQTHAIAPYLSPSSPTALKDELKEMGIASLCGFSAWWAGFQAGVGWGAGPHVDSEYSSVLGGQLYSLQTSNGSVLQPETF